jgi:hypothetical protein
MGIAVLIVMNIAYERTNTRRLKMKKIFVVVMVLVVGIMFVSPTIGYSDPWSRRYPGSSRAAAYVGHYERQPYYPPAPVRYERSRNNNDALLVAGVALGGIALGALLGSVVSQQNTTRQVVYNDPVGYRTAYDNDTPPGQWVTVAGQWVSGKWVPAHNVWVPVNP